MKRPILGLLAAATLSFGMFGIAPAGAAAPSPTAATVTPAHDGDDHGGGGHDTRRHGGYQRPYHGDDDDHDGDRGRRRKCDGLIVVCLG